MKTKVLALVINLASHLTVSLRFPPKLCTVFRCAVFAYKLTHICLKVRVINTVLRAPDFVVLCQSNMYYVYGSPGVRLAITLGTAGTRAADRLIAQVRD